MRLIFQAVIISTFFFALAPLKNAKAGKENTTKMEQVIKSDVGINDGSPGSDS